MVDEFVNEPQDPAEKMFVHLEAQVVDINYNVSLLMEALTNKLGLFGEDGDSNKEVEPKGKSINQKETKRESKKELENDQPSSSVMNHS